MAAMDASPDAYRIKPTPMSRCPPIRSERAPAIGATKRGMIVHGRMRTPLASGL
jgi:hypothetical protein